MKPTRRRALVASIIFLLLGLYSARPIPALANISSDFRQCANMDSSLGDCHWINSVLQGSKSKYIEGMSVPQRLILTDISGASGTTHTLHFHVDATKGGLHAYDWLTSWDQARVAAIQGGIPYNDLFGQTCNAEFDGVLAACQSLAASANHVDVDVPDDAFVSNDGATQPHITAYETAFGNRTVEIFGDASITGEMLTLSHTVPDQRDTGDSTINYSLSWTSASTQIMIELAGHLALGPKVGGIGWGQGLGAGSIPGGPFHISLDDLDGSSLGSQDNQIQPGSGVVVPPQLIVIKHVVGGPNIASDFQITVTATNPSPATFPGAEAPGTTVTLGVGSYSVEEQNLTGYTESKSADCSGSIDAGQTKTCTITNTFKATTSLSTTPNPSTATVGDTLKDSATLSGGFNPTGSITFTLYSDAACTKLTYTDVVTVNGNGTYNTDSAGTPSGGNVSNAAGTWSWTADYSGDQFNSASSSKCGDEPVTVNKANTTIATTQDPSTATVGATLSDKATLSGGFKPTGTITFTLYSDTACTKAGVRPAGSVKGAGA